MTDNGKQPVESDQHRHRLLRNKLGPLLSWKKPTLAHAPGPQIPSAFDPFDAKRSDLVTICPRKLESLSDDQISSIRQPGNDSSVTREWQKFQSEEISSLIKQTPPWFAGGLGHPEYLAEFDHWTKMTHFQVGELTCLSVGIEPRHFSWNTLVDLSTSRDRPKFHEPLGYLVNRFDQLFRTFCHHGRDTRVSPLEFIEWVDRFRAEVHPSFIGPLRDFNVRREDGAKLTPARKSDQREIDSIAQLFAAVCIEEYGYRPGDARSPIPREIGDLATRLGMTITAETVRKYLRIGASFIPDGFGPGGR